MVTPKATEFFIFGIAGQELTQAEYDFIKDNPVGGIILFGRNIHSLPQIVALNRSIIEANPQFPPLISVDQEGGRVARLKNICTQVPPMGELTQAFLKDLSLAYRLGAMQARELVSLGFNLNFSPVCDVLSHNDNQVIGDRSFSDCPETVACIARKYIEGLQGAGLAACAKHFPGHGATSVDSHYALPVLDTDIETLKARELVPFKRAIDAHVATIMTAHIITKAVDSVPATLSESSLKQLLRGDLGYKNVIISDDLDMKAVADHFTLPQIIEMGILASVDLFIVGNNFKKTLDAVSIMQELLNSDERIVHHAKEARERINILRERFLGKPKSPDLSSALAIVRAKPHLDLVRACE